MSAPPSPPPRDFLDRAIRDALEHHRHNLRALVRRVDLNLADRLDFDRRELVPRAFLLDDWRRREADLLFCLPYRSTPEETILVSVLVEHQSQPEQPVPLRLLVTAALYWERQWRDWDQKHDRGQPLRLTPVVPIILHTGTSPWTGPRQMADLIAAPPGLAAYTPHWPPYVLDLAGIEPQDLLQSDEPWWQALAVVRVDRGAEAARFAAVFGEAIHRLEQEGERDPQRWQRLSQLVLQWGLLWRSRSEWPNLIAIARASLTNVTLQREVQYMAQQIEQTWAEESLARATAVGEERGALRSRREVLRRQLQKRFSPLPEELLQRIEAADLARLDAALDQVVTIQRLEDLVL